MIKVFLLGLVVWAVVGFGTTFAQVGCTYRAGTISFIATGGSTNPTYSTQYLLTDPTGTILTISSTTNFTNVAAGTYNLYALNFDPTKALTGNVVNGSVAQIAGNCFDLSLPFAINVCPQPGTACDYPTGLVSFISSGGNLSPGYVTRYGLTDSTGVLRDIQDNPTFAINDPGTYLAYGINYQNDGTLTGLSIGQSLSGVTASCIDIGTPLILEVCAPQLVSLLPKVYLQGALFGVSSPDTLMRDDLRAQGYIPTTSPYPALGLSGLTSVSAVTPTVLSTTGANAIVDWVFVELRNPTSNTLVVDSRSALVQRDGDIVDVDGVSPITLSRATPGSFYVAVRHRNHLGVMTQTALPLSSTTTVVDFRRPTTPTFNLDATNAINQPQVVVDQGVALWAGNTLYDKEVIYQGPSNDVEPISLQVFNAPGNVFSSLSYKLKGYYSGDVNLNGETIFRGMGNDVDYIYQNIIKNHPGNGLKVNFFKIKEQLP